MNSLLEQMKPYSMFSTIFMICTFIVCAWILKKPLEGALVENLHNEEI